MRQDIVVTCIFILSINYKYFHAHDKNYYRKTLSFRVEAQLWHIILNLQVCMPNTQTCLIPSLLWYIQNITCDVQSILCGPDSDTDACRECKLLA